MPDLSPHAAAFLRDASSDAVASLLAHLLDARGRERVDLMDEDSGRRVSYLEAAPGVYVYVDIEKDVLLGAVRASRAELRQHLRATFRGYRCGRAAGFGFQGRRPDVREAT